MEAIWSAFLAVSPLEWFAVSTTALCIWLAGQNKVATWPVGIVAFIAYAMLFYDAKLYADTLLQFFFVGTSIYGWIYWAKSNQQIEPIKRASALAIAGVLFVGVLVTFGYGQLLIKFTDSPAPVLDSSVLVFSILGQLLLMKRYIENWPTWILVNTVSVPLYFSRELYVTAIMYAIFWVHAWYAWWKWSNEMKNSVE